MGFIEETVCGLAPDLAYEGFDVAIKANLLQIHPFQTLEKADVERKGFYRNVESLTTEMVSEFIQVVGESISNGSTYPLFDSSTIDEIQKRIKLGILEVSDTNVERSKHITLAGNLINRLPVLDNVPIDELIDIRTELDKSLSASGLR